MEFTSDIGIVILYHPAVSSLIFADCLQSSKVENEILHLKLSSWSLLSLGTKSIACVKAAVLDFFPTDCQG